MKKAYLGIDIGSISTKGVVLDGDSNILAKEYLWTEGNPMGAVKKLLAALEKQFDKDEYEIVSTGTTGSARKLIGVMVGATIVKNEITAHAVGTLNFYPDVRTILEIGGQDSKIILVDNGVVVDYAMNTLCAAGTGAFLSSQAKRLGVEVEEFGKIALQSQSPTQLAARCTVFAESDLVHKIQMGHTRQDIIAGLCRAAGDPQMPVQLGMGILRGEVEIPRAALRVEAQRHGQRLDQRGLAHAVFAHEERDRPVKGDLAFRQPPHHRQRGQIAVLGHGLPQRQAPHIELACHVSPESAARAIPTAPPSRG